MKILQEKETNNKMINEVNLIENSKNSYDTKST